MPLIWIVILLTYSLITKNPSRRKRSIIVTLSLVLFFGNEFIINEIFSVWEKKPIPMNEVPDSQMAIVLTGVTNTEKESSEDKVFFQKGADRVLHTVQLYKAGKIKKIIISGGSGKIFEKGIIESEQLKKVFLYCGVPDSIMIIENESRNTRENAMYSKKILDSLQTKEEPLLVTSAFHMRRSEGCFEKVGVKTRIYPVDIYTHDRSFKLNKLIIPSESAFSKWALLIHEVLGYIVYKLVGYC